MTVDDSSRIVLKDLIRKVGLRATASRVAVLQLLRSAQHPLSHADVSEALSKEPWDRATLYRNLMDLSEAGLLRRVSLGSTWRFEQEQDSNKNSNQGHPHFVCTECGTVECVPELRMQVSKNTQASTKAIQQGAFDVQLHGLCNDCTQSS